MTDNKIIAALSYIGILCLIPLLAKKDSKFAQEHGKQGLIMLIAWIVLGGHRLDSDFGLDCVLLWEALLS